MLKTKARFAKAFRQLAFLIPISWQCTNDQPTKGIYQKLAALENDAVPTLSFAPGFPAADFRDCGPSVFAYGKTQADADAAADRLVALVEGHEDDFDGRIYLARRRRAPRHGAGEDGTASRSSSPTPRTIPAPAAIPTPPACCARWCATMPLRAAIGVIYDPAVGQGRACCGRRRHRHAGARRQVRHTGRRPLHRKPSSSKNCPTDKFVAPGPYYGGRDMDMGPSACLAHRRCQGRRQLAQSAARGSVDVPLCRYRADRAGYPGQQELGAFPRRFRADRREAADLRRARRDAGGHRGTALDPAASGHPHQAERPRLHSNQPTRSTSSVTG